MIGDDRRSLNNNMQRFLFATLVIVACCGLNYAIPVSDDDQCPVVHTKSGPVQGFVKQSEYEDKKVFVYEGIRYGKAPVGELRFQHPQAAESWTEIYHATHYRNSCVFSRKLKPDGQIPLTKNMGEDCLFLSIYRPITESAQKRPVMFWIHGGTFMTGSAFSPLYDASYLSLVGDVVVVTINYRLGAFGFLFGNTTDAPGNAGLFDQLLALKWVRDNIEAFGGDPNMITVFGESAGSMSAGAFVLSPLAKGLFQRAILESGSPMGYIGINSKELALTKAQALYQRAHCDKSTPQESVDCLRKISAEDIAELTLNAKENGEIMTPVYGDSFLPIYPVEALKTGKFNTDVDLIFGVNSHEGSLFVDILFHNYLDPDIEHPPLTIDLVKTIINLEYMVFGTNKINSTEVAEFYTKGLKDTNINGMRHAIGNSFGDYVLVCPTVFFGEYVAKHSKSNNVFSYRFIHPPALSAFPSCRGYMRVCHADDLVFVFGYPIRLRGVPYTEEDYQISMDVMHAWSHFARHGNPGSMNGVKWTPALKTVNSTVSHFAIDSPDKYQMIDDFFTPFCEKFWKSRLFV